MSMERGILIYQQPAHYIVVEKRDNPINRFGSSMLKDGVMMLHTYETSGEEWYNRILYATYPLGSSVIELPVSEVEGLVGVCNINALNLLDSIDKAKTYWQQFKEDKQQGIVYGLGLADAKLRESGLIKTEWEVVIDEQGKITYETPPNIDIPKAVNELELAAEEYTKNNYPDYLDKKEFGLVVEDFIAGTKYQAKRSYSEEEVIVLLQKYRLDLSSGKTPNLGDTTRYWFEQFRKK